MTMDMIITGMIITGMIMRITATGIIAATARREPGDARRAVAPNPNPPSEESVPARLDARTGRSSESEGTDCSVLHYSRTEECPMARSTPRQRKKGCSHMSKRQLASAAASLT
jgi:hypothetical protein